MPAFEWVHVQLHQQKGMISLSPPTICNSATENYLNCVNSESGRVRVEAKRGERRIRASAAALSAETRRDGRASATRGSRQQLRGSPPTGPRRILSAAVCNRRSARRLLVRVCARRVCNRREGIDPAIQPVDSPSITHPVPSFTHPTPSITHRKPSITHRGVL
ncbi:putative transposase [Escherichia coli]|uniref:Putative transposase n=1 Tax=Escherichia coli TaxID=562 RepID=A0A377F570_ECOLX|nr:putative transposase [Escherichia coli]